MVLPKESWLISSFQKKHHHISRSPQLHSGANGKNTWMISKSRLDMTFWFLKSTGQNSETRSESVGWWWPLMFRMGRWMFPKIVGFPPKSSISIYFNRVFHYFHHPFWGQKTPIFWKHPYNRIGADPLDTAVTTSSLLPCSKWGDRNGLLKKHRSLTRPSCWPQRVFVPNCQRSQRADLRQKKSWLVFRVFLWGMEYGSPVMWGWFYKQITRIPIKQPGFNGESFVQGIFHWGGGLCSWPRSLIQKFLALHFFHRNNNILWNISNK